MKEDLIVKFTELFGTNSVFIQEMYEQYVENPTSVREDWQSFFKDFKEGKIDLGKYETHTTQGSVEFTPQVSNVSNGNSSNGFKAQATTQINSSLQNLNTMNVDIQADDSVNQLSGVALKIAENMQRSLTVPTATSIRTIPVKLLEENRVLINQHLSTTRGKKISFTHVIAYAIVQSLKKITSLNAIYGQVDGKPSRIQRKRINIGLAVDVEKKDGSRSLLVPNIKNADAMNFDEFLKKYDDLIQKARTNKLTPEDFQGTTISLSNPGTIGTIGSVPRLMIGQSAIVATGAIQYSAEYQAMNPELISTLGISKIMTMTNTYDHRIIQGAESGEFLANIDKLLQGNFDFYKNIFQDLQIPYRPWKYQFDKSPLGFSTNKESDKIQKQMQVDRMINAYRVRGHLIADLSPLGREDKYFPELDPEYYGLTIWDLDRKFRVNAFLSHEDMKLRDLIENLRNTYCLKLGVEYMNIQDIEKKHWVTEKMELSKITITPEDKIQALQNLIRAEIFEKFIHTKFLGQKRFSLEGGEGSLVCLDEILEALTNYNGKEVVIGMSHRGRLNVLCNMVGKSYEKLFAEFEGKHSDPTNENESSGDVKYHLGAVGKRTWSSGKEIAVSVASNPSHLEAVNPVVQGIVRAKQDRLAFEVTKEIATNNIVPVLFHGDAAFIGQGVVAETLNMSQLRAYNVGGTIHIIINNQIGFTTLPKDSRSTPYSSDIAKFIQVPIFHVNGDDVEGIIRASRLATEYRNKFKTDVVIDIVCYRKFGHNEGDDPTYTQPLMYDKIKHHSSVLEIYTEKLIRDKVITKEQSEQMVGGFKNILEEALVKAKSIPLKELKLERKADLTLAIKQEDIVQKYRVERPATAISIETLQTVTKAMFKYPDGFHVHPKLIDQLSKRKSVLKENPLSETLDWGFAESLAFGSLCYEHTAVRVCGQDVRRGTFSQRHLELFDIQTGEEYIPLCHITPDQAPLYLYNTHLSEYAALGCEFGYSVADPLTLTVWEAQFGDFSNGAQIIIDQFISSSEAKWGQPSGLVMLLPHGFEGQGPEHSSARLERYLQLCAEVNLQVCNCTTPAQYFHLLRRQIIAGNIKPLIVMTPKSLLRHPLAVSKVDDLVNGKFHNVLDDETEIQNPKRVLLCSGKVYYDLIQARNGMANKNVVIVRVEQLYPFPEIRINKILSKYQSATEICWVQEEPKNMGAWTFISPFLIEQLTSTQKLRYIGRKASASPATGFSKTHEAEQKSIVEESLE